MESAFLDYLAEEGKAWFSIEDAYGAFPDKPGRKATIRI